MHLFNKYWKHLLKSLSFVPVFQNRGFWCQERIRDFMIYKLFLYESELLFDVNYCYYCISVKVYPNDLEMTGSDFDSILEKLKKLNLNSVMWLTKSV